MRGSKAKKLRNETTPHPGRSGGGNVKDVGKKGERAKYVSPKEQRKIWATIMDEWRAGLKAGKEKGRGDSEGT